MNWDLVKKILNFIVECIKAFINIFSFGKFFKKVEPKTVITNPEENKDGLQK